MRRVRRPRRGHARRLLPRRRARGAVRDRSRGRAGPQPDPDGDARRLQRDGSRWSRRCARAGSNPDETDRRDRQRPGRRALQRLLHARADDRRWRRRRRCSRTSGTTSSSRASRRWRQWSRDHVPFPGRRVSSARRAARPPNILMTGSVPLGGRRVDLANAGQRAERDGRARQRRSPGRRRTGHGARRATPSVARSCGCQAVTSPLVPARSAFKHTMPKLTGWIIDHSDRRRGAAVRRRRPFQLRRRRQAPPTIPSKPRSSMEIRPIEAGDRPALSRFFERIPESDRTFLKEDVDDPRVLEDWVQAAAGTDDRGRRTARSSARWRSCALVGWSSHVGEIRLVVDPDHRGQGIGRRLARACGSRRGRHGAEEARRRGDRRPGAADRDVPRAWVRARGAPDRSRPGPIGADCGI